MEGIAALFAVIGIPSGLLALFLSLLWLFGMDVPSGDIAIFGAISITCIVPLVAILGLMWWLDAGGAPSYGGSAMIAPPPPPPPTTRRSGLIADPPPPPSGPKPIPAQRF